MRRLEPISLLLFAVVTVARSMSPAVGAEDPEAFTRIAENGYCAAWSPDGSRIVYGSMGNEEYQIWSVRLVDKKTQQLTTTGAFHPAFSPDGKYVTYDDRGARGRIYRMAVAGGVSTRLTPVSMEGNFSNWSPDGSTIVFSSGGDIWSMPSDGGEASVIISRREQATRPVFSPDGKKIAFDSADAERRGDRDIWVYDMVEETYSRLTNDPGKDIQPHWSPDGTMIAYMSEKSGNRDIWIMRADGSAQVQVTFNEGMDVWPRWAPGGRRLAFGSDRAGSTDIWVVDLERQQPVTGSS
jgi:TolB protein